MSDVGYWSVTVRLNGEDVVTIEPSMLAGRELSKEDEGAIFEAACNLLNFIGEPAPQERAPFITYAGYSNFLDVPFAPEWGAERVRLSDFP